MIGNFVCFIAALSCYFLGYGLWFETLASTFMMAVTIYGFIVSCQINQRLLLSFTILSLIDFFVSISAAITLLILTVRWGKYCRGDISNVNYPVDWTCHDLDTKGGLSFVYAEVGLLFVALFGRVFTALGGFLLAKYYFDGFQSEENK